MACRVRYNGAAPEDSFTATITIPIVEYVKFYTPPSTTNFKLDLRDSSNYPLKVKNNVALGNATRTSRCVNLVLSYNSTNKTASITSASLSFLDGTNATYGVYNKLFNDVYTLGDVTSEPTGHNPRTGASYIYINTGGYMYCDKRIYLNCNAASVNLTGSGVHQKPWTININHNTIYTYMLMRVSDSSLTNVDGSSKEYIGNVLTTNDAMAILNKNTFIKYDPRVKKVVDSSGIVYGTNKTNDYVNAGVGASYPYRVYYPTASSKFNTGILLANYIYIPSSGTYRIDATPSSLTYAPTLLSFAFD